MEPRDLSGLSIGKHRLVRRLGAGGMGEVYLAEHSAIEKKVAIKVLRSEVAQDPDALWRFFNEARAAARIEHPGIINIFDCGQDAQAGAYLVMEYLAGEPLSARLARDAPLSLAALLPIVRPVASALQAAHDAGIYHRDLKPDNIFLVPGVGADQERVVLLDFGIAKLTAQSGERGESTQAGVIMGTPLYMSPEQCESAREADHRSDIYALAAVCYEALIGKPPFVAQDFGRLLRMHLMDAPRSLREQRPELPAAVEAAVLRGLAKRPADRFGTISAFYEALAAPTTEADDALAPTLAPSGADALAPTLGPAGAGASATASADDTAGAGETRGALGDAQAAIPPTRLADPGAAAFVPPSRWQWWAVGVTALLATLSFGLWNHGRSADETPVGATAANVSERPCSARVADFKRTFDRVTRVFPLATRRGIELLRRPGTPPPTRFAVQLTLSSADGEDAFYLAGARLPAAGFEKILGEQLAVFEANRRIEGQKGPLEIVILADSTTRWRIIQRAVAALRVRGSKRVGFGFAIDDPVAPPKPSKVGARIGALERRIALLPSEQRRAARVQAIHDLWRDSALLPCIDINQFEGGLASVEQRRARLRDFLAAALTRCDCRADIASLEHVTRFTVHRAAHLGTHVGVLWRRLDPTGKEIARPGDEPWRKSYRQVAAEERPLRLTIAP